MWWYAAGAVAGLALLSGSGKRAAAKAENRVMEADAKAKNQVRFAGNAAGAAENSLALWAQSVENQARAKAAANQQQNLLAQYTQASQARAAQGLSLGIQDAEALGMSAAATGASGVEGSAPSLVRGATALRSQFAQESADRLGLSQDYAARTQAGALAGAIFTGQDQSVLLARQDYNVTAVQKRAYQSWSQDLVLKALEMAPALLGGGGGDGDQSSGGGIRPDPTTSGSGVNPGAVPRSGLSLSAPKAASSNPYSIW